jgi:hypothetical protein
MMINNRVRTSCLLPLALCGCASVTEVTVRPATICSGDAVSVAWRASGVTSLFQVPLGVGQSDQCIDSLIEGSAPSSVRSKGEVQRQIQRSTVFYVEARAPLGKPAHGCARVFVNEALPLAGIAECSGLRRVRVIVSRPPGSQWGASAKVGSVQNLNEIPIVVSHDGISDALTPGSLSAAFVSRDANGDWTLDYMLENGPDCGQAGAKVPPSLSIRVLPLCANGPR